MANIEINRNYDDVAGVSEHKSVAGSGINHSCSKASNKQHAGYAVGKRLLEVNLSIGYSITYLYKRKE